MTDGPILWFDHEEATNVRVCGGKGASLAAMTAAGLPVPTGFVVCAGVLEESVDAERLRALARANDYVAAQKLVGSAEPPQELAAEGRL